MCKTLIISRPSALLNPTKILSGSKAFVFEKWFKIDIMCSVTIQLKTLLKMFGKLSP